MHKTRNPSLFANPYLDEIKPYIPGLTGREAAERYNIPEEKLIKLSSNENPLGPPPLAVKAAQDMLPALHRYPDSKAVDLRRQIADIEGVALDNVIVGAGSSEIMSFVIRAFSKPGDEIVSLDPSFTVYSELAMADGRRPVLISLDDPFELKIEDVEAKISDRTRVVFITRPNNPTSRLIPIDLFTTIAHMLPHVLVVSDEAYIEFADSYRDQSAVRLINQAENVIVTRTLSKAHGIPNLRVGYAIAPPDTIEYLFKVKPKWNVGEVAQYAAIGALRDHDHLAKVLKAVREGRSYLSERLSTIEGLEVVPEPQGNFIMVRVQDSGFSAESFTEALGQRGILIRGDFHRDYVRISIGTQIENETLVSAIIGLIENG